MWWSGLFIWYGSISQAHQRAEKFQKLVESLNSTVTDGLGSGKMSIKEGNKAVVQLQDVRVCVCVVCEAAVLPILTLDKK